MDLFAAPQADAQKLLNADNPFETWAAVSLVEVDEAAWLAFQKALGARVFSSELAKHESKSKDAMGTTAVHALTERVVEKLGSLTKDERRGLAERWQKLVPGFKKSPLEAVQALCEFCAQAKGKHSVLYVVAA